MSALFCSIIRSPSLNKPKVVWGAADRYIYVAADVYRLPFVAGLFDAATMIRVLHHMADAPLALQQVHQVLQPEAVFILEFANKHNLKAILRYLLKKQSWSPFTLEPVEFAALNFDFHPKRCGPGSRRPVFAEALAHGISLSGWLFEAPAAFQPAGCLG